MTEFTEQLAALICERMAKGETLRAICRDKDMPPESTVRTWAIQDRAGFYAQYTRARELQQEAWADEIVEIASDTANDTHTTVYEDGRERTSPNTEWISRSRLRVDTLKWLMSKLAPKKYGDKLDHQVEGTIKQVLEVTWQTDKSNESK